MNCPFCKHNLNIPETSLSEKEFHYDCPHCHSGLLFEKDQCQVLAEGTLPAESMASSVETEKTFVPSDASSDEETLIEGTDEESPDTSLSENRPSSQKNEALTNEEDVPSEASFSMDEKEDEQNSTNEVPSIDESALHREENSILENEEQENSPQDTPSDESIVKEKKPEDFSDVEKFGNTTGRTHQGPFYYNLLIEEINSKEIREHLNSVLNDEGLNLPPIKIKDGVLKLHRLTPAATHVIVKSLLGWSLKISWKQELAVEMNDEESPDEEDSNGTDPGEIVSNDNGSNEVG